MATHYTVVWSDPSGQCHESDPFPEWARAAAFAASLVRFGRALRITDTAIHHA